MAFFDNKLMFNRFILSLISIFRSVKFLLLSILSIVFVLGCVEKRDLSQNTVVIDLESFPDGLHPTNSNSGSGNFILSYTQSSLMGIDPITEKYKPILIKELPKVDSSGLVYFFELNDKAKWDDGSSLGVEDFIFSWKVTLCPLTNNPHSRGMFTQMIENVYADSTNSNGIFVRVKSPHYKNMEIVAGGVVLIQKNFWDPNGVLDKLSFSTILKLDFISNQALDNWFNDFNDAKNAFEPNRLVGLGPYRLTELANKSYVTLTKKENWWGDKYALEQVDFEAYPDKLIFKVTPDPSAGYLALKCENLDILKNRGSNWISKFRRLRRLDYFNENYESSYVEAPLYRYVGMNMKPDGIDYKPFFVDVRVRRAMAHLTPIDEMIKYLLYGHATRQAGIVAPFNYAIDSTLKYMPYDVSKAEELLTEAGWVDTDGDNIRDKVINGEKVQFTFKLNFYSDPSLKEIALMMQESFSKAGVELVPNPLDFGTLFGNARDHKFDVILAAWGGTVTYSNPYQIWSTKSWAQKGANFIGYGDAESDSLIDASNTQLDEDKHLEAYRALQRKIYDEQPYIFFWSEKYVMACHKRFSNPQFYRAGNNINIGGLKLSHK